MKKILLIAALVVFPSISIAQEINLKFAPADVQLLAEGLGMLPYGKVAPLMQKLQLQINEQTLQKQITGNSNTGPVDATKPQDQNKN